jgi:hypothetical protein
LRNLDYYIKLKETINIIIFAGKYRNSRNSKGIEIKIKEKKGEKNNNGIGIKLYRGEKIIWPR